MMLMRKLRSMPFVHYFSLQSSRDSNMRFTVQRYQSVPPIDHVGNHLPSLSSSTEKDEDRSDAGSPSLPPGSPGTESLTAPVFDTLDNSHPSTIREDETLKTAMQIAQIGQTYHDRKTQRLVYKDGSCNVTGGNITQRKQKYLVDIFTTLVDMKWRYNLLLFISAFVISWLSFAVVWFIIAVAHGDHLHAEDPAWQPCVSNLHDFTTAILFSVETQHTIGYGFRVIEPTCPGALITLMVQSCVGVFIQTLMTGLIFAKLSRPKTRSHTIMFSRNAVVSKQDGRYCLLFRVGDMRKSHFVGTSIRALLVSDKRTREGETLPLFQYPLDLQTDTCNNDGFVFLVWPVTVIHRITSDSPLFNVAADTLLREQFEIIVILEGIVESTGMTTQVRTSYLPAEILWGYQLAPLMTYQKENGQYKIDYTQFHEVIALNSMPTWSAKQHRERRGSDDDPDIKDDCNGYFTTVVRQNTIRQSVIKRMRNGLKRRTGSRDGSRSSNSVNPTKKTEDLGPRTSNASL